MPHRYNYTAICVDACFLLFSRVKFCCFLSVYLSFDPETSLSALNLDLKNVKLS